MDQQLSERGLSLRPFDPEVFARVWSRVMPDQTLSPIQPALPALRSPAQTAPAPSCLGEGSARYVPQLEALMDQLHAALGSVRQLARRGGGRASRLLASLAADQQRQLRRLFSHHRPALCSQGAGGRPLWTAVLRLAHPVSAGPAVRRPGRRAGPDSFG